MDPPHNRGDKYIPGKCDRNLRVDYIAVSDYTDGAGGAAGRERCR